VPFIIRYKADKFKKVVISQVQRMKQITNIHQIIIGKS